MPELPTKKIRRRGHLKPGRRVTHHPIQLDWADGRRAVVVSPRDRDRFMLTCQDAAEACKAGARILQWREAFDAMLPWLRSRIEGLKKQVRACYLGVADRQLVAFVVPRKPIFDFELGETLAGLDRDVNLKFELCPCEVLQIPDTGAETLATFLNIERAITVYGE